MFDTYQMPCRPGACLGASQRMDAIGSDGRSSMIDSFSEEFSKVSLEERSNALNDLHGIADKVVETPEMLTKKCQEMTKYLDNIASRGGSGESLSYKKAVDMSPDYVEGLKARFLRAESYNSLEAAQRMVRFFDIKLELFGEERLARDITQKDLGVKAIEILQSGLGQLLPQRDRAGRAVIFFHGQTESRFEDDVAMGQLSIYFLMAALGDVETQVNGTVGLYYGLGKNILITSRVILLGKIWQAVPIRWASCHCCLDDNGVFNVMLRHLPQLLSTQTLVRWRFHVAGTHVETLYNLMTFGIPRDAIPVEDNGDMVDLSDHQRVVDALRQREEMGQQLSASKEVEYKTTMPEDMGKVHTTILVPGPMDVLLGRGRRPRSRPGSMRLQALLDENYDEYEKARKQQKAALSIKVLLQMKEFGSRFLMETRGGYVECDDFTARQKISHGFRNCRKKSVKAEAEKNENTTTAAKKRSWNEDDLGVT